MQYTNISPDFGVRNITFVIYRGIRRQFPVFSRQSAVCSLQLNGHPFMGAKTWLFKPGRLNCPDFQVAGRSWSVGSPQWAVFSRQSSVHSGCSNRYSVFIKQYSVGSRPTSVDAVISIQLNFISTHQPINPSTHQLTYGPGPPNPSVDRIQGQGQWLRWTGKQQWYKRSQLQIAWGGLCTKGLLRIQSRGG